MHYPLKKRDQHHTRLRLKLVLVHVKTGAGPVLDLILGCKVYRARGGQRQTSIGRQNGQSWTMTCAAGCTVSGQSLPIGLAARCRAHGSTLAARWGPGYIPLQAMALHQLPQRWLLYVHVHYNSGCGSGWHLCLVRIRDVRELVVCSAARCPVLQGTSQFSRTRRRPSPALELRPHWPQPGRLQLCARLTSDGDLSCRLAWASRPAHAAAAGQQSPAAARYGRTVHVSSVLLLPPAGAARLLRARAAHACNFRWRRAHRDHPPIIFIRCPEFQAPERAQASDISSPDHACLCVLNSDGISSDQRYVADRPAADTWNSGRGWRRRRRRRPGIGA
jgi:hypothetical protein